MIELLMLLYWTKTATVAVVRTNSVSIASDGGS